MLNLHVIQAEEGDCLILEFGSTDNPNFILIDGGPSQNGINVEKAIKKIIGKQGNIDLLMLSHVDTDHTNGLLELLSKLRIQTESGKQPLVTIKKLWLNEFSSTFGEELEARMMQVMTASPNTVNTMAEGSLVFNGIGEGHKLQSDALVLKIPVNKGIKNNVISLDNIKSPVKMGSLTLTVLGPTEANLAELKKKWEDWLEAHQEALEEGNVAAAANADKSIPNLSSIIVLAESENKSILFTGDCRGDHLLEGLKKRNLLKEGGTFHVNVLKGLHHGSNRNLVRSFFKTVTADIYVFSANGKDGNPDYDTLEWMILAAKDDKRKIKVIVTNETKSTTDIQIKYPPSKNGYSIKFIPSGKFLRTIKL